MSEKMSAKDYLKALASAIAAWISASVVLLLLFSVLYSVDAAALSTMGYASSAISLFSAFFAGIAAVRNVNKKRLLFGIAAGSILSALLLLCGFIAAGSLEKDAALSAVSFTLTGCMMGAVLPQKKHRHILRSKRRFS